MTDVFISYSRKNTEFVRQLFDALEKTGRKAWVDWEGIPYSVDWWQEICRGIDASDIFLFVISPASLESMICQQEVAYARQNNKRLIPVIYEEVAEEQLDPLWQGQEWQATAQENWTTIKHLNWLFFNDATEFSANLKNLTETIARDPLHVREHTRLLVKTREWEQAQQNASLLLRGDELSQAETWLAQANKQNPYPTALQTDFILQSRQAERSQQGKMLIGVSVALIVSIGMAVLAFVFYLDANTQRQIAEDNYQQALQAEALAKSEALTAYSIVNENDGNFELAVRLAIEANEVRNPSPNAKNQLAQLIFGADWQVEVARVSTAELINFVEERFVVPELSCPQRERFNVELLCN